jgi:hypothetical protein
MCDNSVAHIDSQAVAGIASPSLGDEKEVPGSIVRRARMCCRCKSYERRCCRDQDRMLGQDSSPKQSCNLCSGRWPTHLGRSQQAARPSPPRTPAGVRGRSGLGRRSIAASLRYAFKLPEKRLVPSHSQKERPSDLVTPAGFIRWRSRFCGCHSTGRVHSAASRTASICSCKMTPDSGSNSPIHGDRSSTSMVWA